MLGFLISRVMQFTTVYLFSKTGQSSENASGCHNYKRVLNIPGVRICQVSAYALHKVLRMPKYCCFEKTVPTMPKL